MSRDPIERAHNDGWVAAFKRDEAEIKRLRAEIEELQAENARLKEIEIKYDQLISGAFI